MNKATKLFFVLFIIFILVQMATHLCATQKYWSDLPSTKNIERHDSLTGFDVTKYVLTLSINDATHFLDGNVKAFVTAESTLANISYELMGGTLAVTQVLVNDVSTTFTHANGIINIPVNFVVGQQFTTQVFYSGTPALSPAPYNIGIKFNTSGIYTLSNPDAGRYYWPCYDHPWDKALIDLHITVRSDWLVAANGIRQSITDNGNGTKTHFWSHSSPVATYVIGFAAAAFVEFNQMAGTLPIQNFVLPNQLNNAQADFANVPEMINYFSSVYGPYPFEKYGHAVISISPYAAMEHQTMTTFGSQYINGQLTYEHTVAHELAHQWMGNCVTPLTMQDVWLKESFATYSEFLWQAHHYGWTSGLQYLASQIQNYYISWENSNGPHTIYNPVYNELFAPPTYEKSASVLHMLRLKLGNAAFFNFVQTYFNTYYNGNVITAEIKAAAEQASGVNLDQFFQQWIYSPGIPSAKLIYLKDNNGLMKVIAQTASPTTTQFDIEIPLKLTNSALLDSVVIRATAQGFANVLPYNPATDNLANLQIDPNHWVLNRGYSLSTFSLNQCLPANHSVTLNWSSIICPLPLTGYNVYRKRLPDGLWTQLNNFPLAVLSYTDVTATNGFTYQYYITAEDEQGFETLPTNIMSATPLEFPFDWGILLVDETRDGTGALFSPTDQMVDSFYANVMTGFEYTAWDYFSMGVPTLSTLSHYPLVIWHGDDYSEFMIDDVINTLQGYLISGGKLLVSGWKYPGALPQSFFDYWFNGMIPTLIAQPTLISANSDFYQDLSPDPEKLTPTWNGMLSMGYIFPQATQIVYEANILDNGTGHGQPLAVRADNVGTVVLLGFPLYYMMQSQVQTFLSQIIPQLYTPTGVTEELSVLQDFGLNCYPNPFQGNITLQLKGKPDAKTCITIYNLKGQRVKQWTGQDAKNVVWNGKDDNHSPVSSGLYFVRTNQGSHSVTTKILKLE